MMIASSLNDWLSSPQLAGRISDDQVGMVMKTLDGYFLFIPCVLLDIQWERMRETCLCVRDRCVGYVGICKSFWMSLFNCRPLLIRSWPLVIDSRRESDSRRLDWGYCRGSGCFYSIAGSFDKVYVSADWL